MFNSSLNEIVHAFRKKVCEQINITPHGLNQFRVQTPFSFEDGDAFVIYLLRQNNQWILSDNGHTLMHLSYWFDTERLNKEDTERYDIFHAIVKSFGLIYEQGKIMLPVEDEGLFGDYLLSYLQALTKLSDLDYLTEERVKRAFLDDLQKFMKATYHEKANLDWTDPERDKQGTYTVDVRLDLVRLPFFVYAVWSNFRALNAVISIMKHREWNTKFRSLVVFEYYDEIPLAYHRKIDDAANKVIPSFYGNEEGIKEYISEESEYIG